MLALGEAARIAERDFAEARELGVTKYPTLFVVDKGRMQRLPGLGSALVAMSDALDMVLSSAE